MRIKIRNLKADEIECRVGAVSEKGATLLLYKNARVDQAILDEVFGITGWQRTHCQIGGEIYCTISIWDVEKSMWVQKQDVGTESDYEKVKGAASDSFKRACFNLGIGRELYTAPFIFIPVDRLQIETKNGKKIVKDKFSVKTIGISQEGKTITNLEIINQKGQKVFCYEQKQPSHTLAQRERKILAQELARTGVQEDDILKRYSLESLNAMDQETYLRALTALRKTKTAA